MYQNYHYPRILCENLFCQGLSIVEHKTWSGKWGDPVACGCSARNPLGET
jgi:hypothetical protein